MMLTIILLLALLGLIGLGLTLAKAARAHNMPHPKGGWGDYDDD